MPRIDDIRIRRGTAAQWTAANPILNAGEPGLETDTIKTKYGDGITPWNGLPYASGGSGGTSSGNVDGGTPTSNETGTTPVDGGNPTSTP